MMNGPSQSPSPIGNASLGLGIASAALVFGIGLCALTGAGQRWLQLAGTPLFVCGGASAFLGLLAAGLGLAGSFGPHRKAPAIAGMLLGLLAVCLFFTTLVLIRNGA